MSDRFFIDHGVIHDRTTGKHVTLSDDGDTDKGLQICCDLMNQLAAPAPIAPSDALRKLCDQLDAMKRRMRHTPGTGQNHSYLLHEDVEAYVEEARTALAAPAQTNGEDGYVCPPGKARAAWLDAEKIRDAHNVDMALENFAHDATADNATGIVLAVLTAAQNRPVDPTRPQPGIEPNWEYRIYTGE